MSEPRFSRPTKTRIGNGPVAGQLLPAKPARRAAKAETCISEAARSLLIEAFPDNTELHTYLEKDMATCATDSAKAPRAKRPPSEYNIFIGSCLKAAPPGDQGEKMRACAAEWKSKKAAA